MKICEIKGGSQEMVAVMLMVNNDCALIMFISRDIIAGLPSLISQPISPRHLKVALSFTVWLFSLDLVFYKPSGFGVCFHFFLSIDKVKIQ